jgi:predicted metalloprotease
MRWDDFRRSSNIEDRRGDPSSGGGFGARGGGLGIGTIVVLGLVGWALGIDPRWLIGAADVMSDLDQPQASSPANTGSTAQGPRAAPGDAMGQFVAAVLGDTEDRWQEIFASAGQTYRPPSLVMFSGATRSSCGAAQAAMGPFYCPVDRRVYLDTSFFRQIETRFHGCDVGSSACQFAEAYVIAHEVGHHVQNLLGILPQVHDMQASMGQARSNQLQVRVELQADCLAGVWANRSQQKWKSLEPGDIEAALRTASAIGDDTLQKQAQGYVVPDAFTHGSAEQRQRWLTAGLKGGTLNSCDTFNATRL